MCWRFQTGSKSPLANRKARMLLTDSLPRKWSIRKICDSSKTWCTAWLSSLAEARSVPNGFSMMIRLRPSASPVLPSKATVDWNDTGGMARWNSRRARPPRSASARRTAASSGPEPPGSLGCELPNDSAWANAVHPSPSGLLRPNAATACLGLLAELVIGDRPPGGADDAVPLRHQADLGQVEQTRQKFPFGQVAGRAEHHDDMVVWAAAGCPGHGFPGHRLAGLSAPRCW